MGFRTEFLNRVYMLPWFILFLSFAAYILLRRKRSSVPLPPGPRGLPFVGYLPFLGSDPVQKLQELGKKYGGLFGLYLGNTYVVVVTDYSVAKELLSKSTTADRPPDMFHSMPNGVGLAEQNGVEWMEQRRYTLQKMKNLGFGKSEWERQVLEESRCLADLVSQSHGQPLDLDTALSASISNNTLSLVSGYQLPMGDYRRDIVDLGVESFTQFFNQSGVMSYYPKLFKAAVNLGLIRDRGKLKAMSEMNKYIRTQVEESKTAEVTHSYIQEYLMEIEKNKELNLGNSFNETNMVGNVQALIIAGSDTTKVSLLWLFLAMASFPDIQDRIHKELDCVQGKDEELSGWVDRTKLPYCYAAILEGQRWRTVVPLNLTHRTNSDTMIQGYLIQKHSNIMAMLEAFHYDDRYWPDPSVFRPNRFLSEDGKVIKKVESYAPFSVGKRFCIGETVANIQLFVYFVVIMKRFRILPVSDSNLPNLKGIVGLTQQPPPQQLRYVQR